MSGFCTGAVLASRGGGRAAFQAGMVGGIILGVIEGLNFALTRAFSNFGGPEADGLVLAPGGDADASDQTINNAEAQQPWWAKLIAPAAPPPDVDFSDPKEVSPARLSSPLCRDTSSTPLCPCPRPRTSLHVPISTACLTPLCLHTARTRTSTRARLQCKARAWVRRHPRLCGG